ncbi:hypothetical protein PYCC9005_004587 [Savitreella phatthalungensis]
MRVALFNNTPAHSFKGVSRKRLYDAYRDWILESIASANEPVTLTAFTPYDVTVGEYPSSLDDIDWIHLTGGTDPAYSDDLPWLTREIGYMRSILLHHKRIKVTAVCFGLHVITRALGGVVGENDNGVEIGVKEICLTDAGKGLFRRDSIRLHQIHFCIVQRLPEGCESLGSSDLTPCQGFVRDRQVLVLQGHPEFSKDIVDDYLKERPGHFGDLPEIADVHDGLEVGQRIISFIAQR